MSSRLTDRPSGEQDQDRVEGSARLVDILEALGGEAGFGEGGEDTGSGVDAGESDREDGDADRDVEL